MKKLAPQSHLTLSDRITIEASPINNHKGRNIARQLKKVTPSQNSILTLSARIWSTSVSRSFDVRTLTQRH